METISDMVVNTPYQEEANTSRSPEVLEPMIFAQSSDISRLSPGDADVFRDAFRHEAVCYANSWLYILRSTRNSQGEFGYKFVGKDTIMGIGYRNNAVYLVHPMGAGRFAATLDLCYRIRRNTPYPIILKKVDQKLYEYLYASNLFQEPTRDAMFFEEEAFPEHTLYLERLYEQDFQKDHQSLPLMRKVKRFDKSSMHLLAKTDVSSIENSPGFHSLFGSNPDKYRSYLHIIREASSRNDRYKICAYVDEHETIHGLYISERLGEESMGLYCAVSSRAHPGITEWMDYDFFRQLFHDRIHYVYLGGSETEGVHSYVQKLLPLAPPYLMRPMGCIPMRNYSL
jgi:hypothetical protein